MKLFKANPGCYQFSWSLNLVFILKCNLPKIVFVKQLMDDAVPLQSRLFLAVRLSKGCWKITLSDSHHLLFAFDLLNETWWISQVGCWRISLDFVSEKPQNARAFNLFLSDLLGAQKVPVFDLVLMIEDTESDCGGRKAAWVNHSCSTFQKGSQVGG